MKNILSKFKQLKETYKKLKIISPYYFSGFMLFSYSLLHYVFSLNMGLSIVSGFFAACFFIIIIALEKDKQVKEKIKKIDKSFTTFEIYRTSILLQILKELESIPDAYKTSLSNFHEKIKTDKDNDCKFKLDEITLKEKICFGLLNKDNLSFKTFFEEKETIEDQIKNSRFGKNLNTAINNLLKNSSRNEFFKEKNNLIDYINNLEIHFKVKKSALEQINQKINEYNNMDKEEIILKKKINNMKNTNDILEEPEKIIIKSNTVIKSI